MLIFDEKDTGEEDIELDPVLDEDEGFQDDEDFEDEASGQNDPDEAEDEGDDSETSDGGSETAGEDNAGEGSEETDTKGKNPTEEADTTTTKKPLSKEENAANARRRREEQLNAKLREERVNTIIEVLGGKNPFTGKEMTDAHDVEVYERMKRIEKAGGDPVADYASTLAEERRQAERSSREAATAKEDFATWAKKDGESFKSAHPGVDVSALFKDETFATIAEPLLKRQVPMTEIYKIYQKTQTNIDSVKQKAKKQLKDEVAGNIANERASAGGLKAKGDNEGALYTKEQLAAMSQEELDANWDKVEKSYYALSKKK
jgi:tRNA(Ser,Leu) C12 N-acetylase TAN1